MSVIETKKKSVRKSGAKVARPKKSGMFASQGRSSLSKSNALLRTHIATGLVGKSSEAKGIILRNENPRVSSGEPDNSMASALTSPNVVYSFKLQGFSTIVSTGGSIINFSIPFDPSSSGYNFSEWASLAALFSEVRLHSFRVEVCMYDLTFLTAGALAPLVIGSNLVSSAAPGTEGAVAALTDAVYHPPLNRSARGWTHRFVNSGLIGWSATSSVTVTPYAGCPGSFQCYSAGFPMSSNVGKVLVQGIYQFRARS